MRNERYNSSFLVPDFVDIQRKSFFHLLKNGILEEFSKVNPIVSDISQLKLTFYPEKFLLILPDLNVPEAILEGKTYSCKLYVPAAIDVYKTKGTFSMKKGFEGHPRPTRKIKSFEANDSLSSRVYDPIRQLSISSVSPNNIGPDVSSLIKQESKTRRYAMTDSHLSPRIPESNWKAVRPTKCLCDKPSICVAERPQRSAPNKLTCTSI